MPCEPTDLTDRIAESVLKATISAGTKLMENPEDYDARANMMWASSLSHNDLTGCGRQNALPVHQLEHALSGEFDQIAHGAGLAVLFPAWAKYIYKHNIPRFAQFARRVWDCTEENDEAAALLQPLLGMKDAEALAPTYLRWLADFRLERGEWAEAEAAARVLSTKSTATDADKVLAQTLIGKAAQGRGQTATALAAYEAALNVCTKPTAYDAEAAVGLGELRLAEGDYLKAKEAFTRAIATADLDTADGRLNRAKAYTGLASACKAAGLNAEALRANMSLIIFFDDKERVTKAFQEAIALLDAEGRTREADRLRQELNERYGAAQ
jgi:tetratricopeptide (TPR) repeat protein